MELAADRVVVPTSEWACRMWQNWKWKRTQHTKAKKKKHTEHWAALRHTTEIMQTKQLFDCRPVSVVRRSFLFFCSPLSSSHRGRGAFGYTRGALANCVITSLPSKAYNTLRERHKSNSSPLLIQFCFFLSFFHSLFYGFLLALPHARRADTLRTRGQTEFISAVTSLAHQCHSRIQDSSAMKPLFIVLMWAPAYVRCSSPPVMVFFLLGARR